MCVCVCVCECVHCTFNAILTTCIFMHVIYFCNTALIVNKIPFVSPITIVSLVEC